MVSNKTKDRRAADNSVYVAIAGDVVNRRSVLLKNFVLIGQESASNPLLHIHANRYGQVEKIYYNTKYKRTSGINI